MSADAALCLANSFDWYGRILGAHGISGRVADGLWTCRDPVPPYYSNAITVAPSDTERQYAAIAELARSLDGPFSVKDSFAALDLSPLGFRVLFAANWIRRDPLPGRRKTDDTTWNRITAPSDLAAWERAWQDNGSPADRRIFPPTLIDDPAIAFLACRSDDRLVAGCAGSRSGDAMSFSNFFTEAMASERDFALGVEATATLAPDLPIVGYEHGPALAWALDAGFRNVGPLRVWLKELC